MNGEKVQVFDDTRMGGQIYRHPAFGQIQVSRITGSTELYGSEFGKNSFVRITIKNSELGRSLSNDWPHSRGRVCELDMSESQWATFVSSFNQGEGIQCTLKSIQGEQIPDIIPEAPAIQQFKYEHDKTMQAAIDNIKVLSEAIEGTKISKKQKDELQRTLNHIHQNVGGSLDYVSDQFDEHMEKKVQEAKSEVHAYVNQSALTAGMNFLENKRNED